MNYKSIFNVVGIAIVAALFCVGCGGGGGNRPASLTGRWVDINPKPEDSEEFELFSDGTAVFKNEGLTVSGTWNVIDKRFVVTVTVDGTNISEAYDYKLSGYELTLINNGGDTSICVKKEKLEEYKAKKAAEKAKRIAAATSTFKDSRDGKTYRKIKVGRQTWMGENLNYDAEGSKCYDNNAGNCEKYGRLYNWETALTVCPAGFHLPSDDEWEALTEFVGGDSTAGKNTKLKSTAGWNNDGNGTDDYGFSALPGGYGSHDGSFSDVGSIGFWALPATRGQARYMRYNNSIFRNYGSEITLFSVRCVQDDKKYVEEQQVKQAFERGKKALDSEEYDKAIDGFNEAIKLNPNYAEAYIERGHAYFGKKDYDKGIEDYTSAIRLDSNSDYYMFRGNSYRAKKDYDKAIVDYNEAIRLYPNWHWYYTYRGYAYHYGKKDYDKAIADYNQAMQLEPKDAETYNGRGYAYIAKKDYDKAIADFNKAIQLEPNSGSYYDSRGDAYRERKEYDRAIADYTKAIQLDTNITVAYINRCYVYAEKGEHDNAISDCNKAIRLDSKSETAYDTRGFAYLKNKDYDKAIADFEKSLSINPDHERAKERLAEARKQKGSQ